MSRTYTDIPVSGEFDGSELFDRGLPGTPNTTFSTGDYWHYPIEATVRPITGVQLLNVRVPNLDEIYSDTLELKYTIRRENPVVSEDRTVTLKSSWYSPEDIVAALNEDLQDVAYWPFDEVYWTINPEPATDGGHTSIGSQVITPNGAVMGPDRTPHIGFTGTLPDSLLSSEILLAVKGGSIANFGFIRFEAANTNYDQSLTRAEATAGNQLTGLGNDTNTTVSVNTANFWAVNIAGLADTSVITAYYIPLAVRRGLYKFNSGNNRIGVFTPSVETPAAAVEVAIGVGYYGSVRRIVQALNDASTRFTFSLNSGGSVIIEDTDNGNARSALTMLPGATSSRGARELAAICGLNLEQTEPISTAQLSRNFVIRSRFVEENSNNGMMMRGETASAPKDGQVVNFIRPVVADQVILDLNLAHIGVSGDETAPSLVSGLRAFRGILRVFH